MVFQQGVDQFSVTWWLPSVNSTLLRFATQVSVAFSSIPVPAISFRWRRDLALSDSCQPGVRSHNSLASILLD